MENFDVLNEMGEFTNEIASSEECHKKGLYHKAAVVFIINSKNEVLIQQRSSNKKLWPNKWDITAGGHVDAGEFGYEAVIRETKEEIGIDITEKDLLFIGSTISHNEQNDIINNHFNEFYIVKKDLDKKNIKLDLEEVQDIKWISKEEILKMIKEKNTELTEKWSCWNYLKKYLERF